MSFLWFLKCKHFINLLTFDICKKYLTVSAYGILLYLFHREIDKYAVSFFKPFICLSVVVFFFSSKDTLVKFWDLDTQHCFKTLVGHRTEVGIFHCQLFLYSVF